MVDDLETQIDFASKIDEFWETSTVFIDFQCTAVEQLLKSIIRHRFQSFCVSMAVVHSGEGGFERGRG